MSTDTITAEQALDAHIKLCKAKDGLVPYSEYLFQECTDRGGAVSAGIDTALEAMATQWNIVYEFICQQDLAEKKKAKA